MTDALLAELIATLPGDCLERCQLIRGITTEVNRLAFTPSNSAAKACRNDDGDAGPHD